MKKLGIIPRLQTLPTAQIDALVQWLTEENLTYDQARKRLKAEFGVRTGNSALSSFWHQVCEPRRFAKLREQERAQAQTDATKGRTLLQIVVRAEADNQLRIIVTGSGVGEISTE